MKGANHSLTKRELMIAVWESLDCESVGARELEEIQRAVRARFGEGAVESPASIARLVSDEGAVLRHPEVIECDAAWRERNAVRAINFDVLTFRGLGECLAWMNELGNVRRNLAEGSDETGLRLLCAAVQQIRQECKLVADNDFVDENRLAEAGEFAEWLAVWLEQPEVFPDWVDLRRRSTDFVKRFPGAFS